MNLRVQQVSLVSLGVFQEMRRRKDFTLLLLIPVLATLFPLGIVLLGIERPAVATFLLNLMLSLAGVVALITTLVISGRQFPDEYENRTILTLMARPIRRSDVVIGKWLPGVFVGVLAYTAGILPPLWIIPRMEWFSNGTLAQMLTLFPFAIAMTAAMSIVLTLWLPRLSGMLIAFALTFASVFTHSLPTSSVFLRWLPSPGTLNLTVRYTDGIEPLGGGAFIAFIVYGSLWTLLLLSAAMRLFSNKNL